MEKGLKTLTTTGRTALRRDRDRIHASRRSRFSPAINDSGDETTLTPRAPSLRTFRNPEAVEDMCSPASFGADRPIGQLAASQPPKLPNFNNIFAEPNGSYRISSPYYQSSAVSTH